MCLGILMRPAVLAACLAFYAFLEALKINLSVMP